MIRKQPLAVEHRAKLLASGNAFANTLLDSFKQVSTLQANANQAVESLINGKEMNPVKLLAAVQKTDLVFFRMMQIRNKMIAAYDELKTNPTFSTEVPKIDHCSTNAFSN